MNWYQDKAVPGGKSYTAWHRLEAYLTPPERARRVP